MLIDEFQVKVPALGEALAAYFGVPYEPFKADRIKPADLLRNMSREFCQTNMWVPIDDTKEGIIVLTTDPEKIRRLANGQQRLSEKQDRLPGLLRSASSCRRSTRCSAASGPLDGLPGNHRRSAGLRLDDGRRRRR